MSHIIPFISKRQTRNNPYKFNCNFLLNRFVCEQEESFSVPGSVGGAPPFACQFRKDHSSGDNQSLAVASEEGDIILLNPNSSGRKIKAHSWTAHNNAIFDICWLPDTPKIISCSGDHTAVLWDAVTHDKLYTFEGHTGSVKCADICPGQSSVFATGSRDGTVNVWDTRIQKHMSGDLRMKPEITIASYMENKPNARSFSNRKGKNATYSPISRSITSVAFKDDSHLASSDCAETSVKIWDLRRTYSQKLKNKPNPKYILSYKGPTKKPHGSINMTFDSTHQNLYVCCTDDNIYALDCHSYSNDSIPVFHGLKAWTFYLKLALSCDDQFLLCGSSDEKAYLWNVSQPGPPLASLSGHRAEVTAVAWHPQKLTTLATCGDDYKVLIWNVAGEDSMLNEEKKYVGFASLARGMTECLENTDLKNTNDNVQISHMPRRECLSSLKECSLTHFFSYLNSCIPCHCGNSSDAQTQPLKKFKLSQAKQSSVCNENIFQTPLPCFNKNAGSSSVSLSSSPMNNITVHSHGKENFADSGTELISDEIKHLSPKKRRNLKLNSTMKSCTKRKLKLSPKNVSSSKKPKHSTIQGNLITCYFQEPAFNKEK